MDNRESVRHRIGVLSALITHDNKFLCFCALENASAGGAKLKLTKEIELPKTFTIILSSKDGPRRNCSLVWQDADRVGVRFLPDEEVASEQSRQPQPV